MYACRNPFAASAQVVGRIANPSYVAGHNTSPKRQRGPRWRFRLVPICASAFSSLLVLSFAAAGLAGELHTLANKTISGELLSLSDKEVVFRSARGEVKTPVGDILVIELQRETPLATGVKYADIELIDGTLLHCSKYSFKAKELEATLAGSELKIKLPIAYLSYLLNDAQEPAIRQEWQEKFVAKKGNQDLLAIRRDGVTNGLEGTLGDAANENGEISFEYDVGGSSKKRGIDPFKSLGLLFVRSLPPNAPASLCKVFDVNQNTVMASKLDMGANSFTVTSIAGVKIEYPRQAVARLDYSNDKVVFLSDLKPAELVEKSKQGRKDTVRMNRNLDNNNPIELEDQVYPKGLALHAYAELVYNLDGKYQKFDAVLGMDAKVGGNGKPQVTIEGDGNKLFSETVTRQDKRRDLSFSVKGVKQLRIVVSSSGLFDFGDHVDLANAKLSK